jgi:hypothetical protein
MVHEPGRGPLDDPAPREDLEASRRDAVDGLDGDAERLARLGEGRFEATVAEDGGKARRLRPRSIAAAPPRLSLLEAARMTNATSRPGVSTSPKTLRPFTFLPAS